MDAVTAAKDLQELGVNYTPAKQGYMSLCKAAAETATSRQVVGLLD